MQKTKFLTIFPSFENLEVVRQTLPTVIAETKENDARLIVHDSSVKNREEKWAYLTELNKKQDFFLLLSDNLSMAHARNLCLQLGQELYAPEYICMLEDDHGFRPGLIEKMIQNMDTYYAQPSPNGLRYGLFSGCTKHLHASTLYDLGDGNACPTVEGDPLAMGGVNSCFRCAPTSHWNNVLKGYDTDEYLISTYQTKNLNYRNYNKGFTSFFLHNGEYVFDIDTQGRGFTDPNPGNRLWDEQYTASDPRSTFRGKQASKPNNEPSYKKVETTHADNTVKKSLKKIRQVFDNL